MSKILMFVDAENVSREQVRNYLAEARSMLQETDTFVGKCYGSKDVLGSMISFFLENGFDFIDTAVYTQAKKNLADMKIIVDSIWDILETFRGDIKAVYILSNDCDFNPLIYKLKTLDIVVKAASFDSFLCVRNAGNKNTTTEDPNANQPQGVEVSSEVEIIE